MYNISIIIPVYNKEDTIQRAFESIKNQSIGFESLEVIFVDDSSIDNSVNIIKELSENYKNVKSINLSENSGFAGKPRNVGIENATAPYLMFLDPDDVFLEDACKILYESITENDSDIASGNYNINKDNKIVRNDWDILKLNDGESRQAKNIKEYFNFILPTPSVWSKIFKREFVLKEKLEFLVGVPAEDLVFVSEALLKANGIKFINKPVVEYMPQATSVTSTRNKEVLLKFIESYTKLFNMANSFNRDYAWISYRNLFFWMKQFCLSDLAIRDKIDLLYVANPLFEEFIATDKLKIPEFLDEFLDAIAKKDFLEASRISEKMDIYYDENILLERIKEKEIFLLFYGLDIEIGGLAKATFNRANLLKKHGYDVTLLNLNESINCRYITRYFHENRYLDESIDIINIVEYYGQKNNVKEIQKSPLPNSTEKKDKTRIAEHYDNNGKLCKRKYEFDDYCCEETPESTDYYTKDGFKYLTVKNGYTLIDRDSNFKIEFKDMFEFHNYFITEILLKCEKKPFLINENSGKIPNFNDVSPKLAHKIASIHTNPYKEEYHYGSPLRDNFTILKNTTDLEYIVVLTEKLKEDLIKEFNFKNIKAIPNILNMTESKNTKKENNKISIFARLSHEKNISDAIKAFKIVAENKKDTKLEIFGRAVIEDELVEEKRLKKLVKELELEDNVIFKGHTYNAFDEMSKSLATLFVSDYEGLGMVVLESMVNQTPVISYDINYGPSDFIKDGENGFLVKQYDINTLAEKILYLLNNPDKAVEMGKAAQRDVLEKIDDETLFLKWQDVLRQVYINSQSKNDLINKAILQELIDTERVKIKLYKENHRLYNDNKFLKRQINSKKGIKGIFKKFGF